MKMNTFFKISQILLITLLFSTVFSESTLEKQSSILQYTCNESSFNYNMTSNNGSTQVLPQLQQSSNNGQYLVSLISIPNINTIQLLYNVGNTGANNATSFFVGYYNLTQFLNQNNNTNQQQEIIPNMTFSQVFLKGMSPSYVIEEGPLTKVHGTNGLFAHYYRQKTLEGQNQLFIEVYNVTLFEEFLVNSSVSFNRTAAFQLDNPSDWIVQVDAIGDSVAVLMNNQYATSTTIFVWNYITNEIIYNQTFYYPKFIKQIILQESAIILLYSQFFESLAHYIEIILLENGQLVFNSQVNQAPGAEMFQFRQPPNQYIFGEIVKYLNNSNNQFETFLQLANIMNITDSSQFLVLDPTIESCIPLENQYQQNQSQNGLQQYNIACIDQNQKTLYAYTFNFNEVLTRQTLSLCDTIISYSALDQNHIILQMQNAQSFYLRLWSL